MAEFPESKTSITQYIGREFSSHTVLTPGQKLSFQIDEAYPSRYREVRVLRNSSDGPTAVYVPSQRLAHLYRVGELIVLGTKRSAGRVYINIFDTSEPKKVKEPSESVKPELRIVEPCPIPEVRKDITIQEETNKQILDFEEEVARLFVKRELKF